MSDRIVKKTTQTGNSNFQNTLIFDEIQSIAKEAQDVLNQLDICKQNRKILARKYKELKESNNPNYEEKLELLFLHGFKKVVSYNRSEKNRRKFEDNMKYKLTGPSCRSATIKLHGSVQENSDESIFSIEVETPYTELDSEYSVLDSLCENDRNNWNNFMKDLFMKCLLTLRNYLGLKTLSLDSFYHFISGNQIETNARILLEHQSDAEYTIADYNEKRIKFHKLITTDTISALKLFNPVVHQHDNQIMNAIYELVKTKNDSDFTLSILNMAPQTAVFNSANSWEPLLQYIPVQELQSEKLMKMLKEHIYLIPEVIKRICESSKPDIAYCNDLLKLNPTAFSSLPVELRVDHTLLDTCLENAEDFCVAQYLSTECRDNASLMLKCLEQVHSTLYCISERLKNDKEFIIAAMDFCGPDIVFDVIPDTMKCDEELLTAAVDHAVTQKEGFVVPDCISLELATKMAASGLLQYLPPKFKSNRDVVMVSICCDPDQLQHASKALRADSDFVRLVLSNNEDAKEYIAPELLLEDEFKHLMEDYSLIDSLDKYTYLKLLRYHYRWISNTCLPFKTPKGVKEDYQVIFQKLHIYSCSIPKQLQNDLIIRRMKAIVTINEP
jgi:hypothetical protein